MLLDIADKRGASSVIVVHNHLNGDADPSEEDVKFTLQMRRILASAGIKLITHYVVAGFIVTEVGRSESQ
jgi:DNA repair protein RadC